VNGEFLHFASKWMAVLIIPLAVAAIRGWLLKRPSLRVSSLEPARAGRSPVSMLLRVPLLCEVIGLGLLIVALCHPQAGRKETITRKQGIDIMLALDISTSMDIYDAPENIRTEAALANGIRNASIPQRIALAKQEVARFIDRRPNDRIGLVAFAGVTYTVCPPTLDHDFLKSHLAQLKTGMIEDGTGIAAPIAGCVTRLRDSPAKKRVMVLFTDGADNRAIKITPLQAAKIAADYDITIHTVGLGGNRAFTIRNFFGRSRMQQVDASYDRGLLKAIAAETGGRYFAAESDEEFREVLEEIDRLETVELESPEFVDYEDRFWPWLMAGAALLLIGFCLEHTLLVSVP